MKSIVNPKARMSPQDCCLLGPEPEEASRSSIPAFGLWLSIANNQSILRCKSAMLQSKVTNLRGSPQSICKSLQDKSSRLLDENTSLAQLSIQLNAPLWDRSPSSSADHLLLSVLDRFAKYPMNQPILIFA